MAKIRTHLDFGARGRPPLIRVLRGVVLFLCLLVCGYVSVRWGGLLKVREVRIFPTRYVAVEKLTGAILGANILRLNLEPLCREIQSDPRVLGVVTRIRFFYGRVEIEVRERTPVLAVELQGGKKVWVDGEGVILEEAQEARIVGVFLVEGRVPKEVVEAGLAWERLPVLLRERYPKLDFSSGEGVALGTPPAFLGAICQVPEKLGILTKLWRAGLLEGYKAVDLRPNDVVILKRGG
jgi:cell division septal protein FtsQ